jgi:hypothetical protein
MWMPMHLNLYFMFEQVEASLRDLIGLPDNVAKR